MSAKPLKDRVTLVSSETLSDDWVALTKHTFDYERRDGRKDRLSREVYHRPDAACVLPVDRARGTVLLVRQLRLPAFLHGDTEPLWEVCAGTLEDEGPEACIEREAVEELGYRLHELRLVATMYGSPGSLSERIFCFTSAYTEADKVSEGGGASDEGEDIEVIELPISKALDLLEAGEIRDAKTLVLLQHLQLQTGA